ncbi:uncharacterized protein LOC118403167 [Branchiostoma floridae]|uniref:Uncharacterized protein LOC118403167 n=1 Tax=Branchiostoma floridae TaxID=7739 RepID=C3Z027_BRAFL|nr:uncharacterized protein LOC118403167 [Branchiostoma floridae]|eukprot:XP_002598074.1 hypothetical protein BRAFLDRAFT_85710 [Branchiostoma floridae]
MNSSKWWGNLWGKSKSKKQYKKAFSSGAPPETEGEDVDDAQDGGKRRNGSWDNLDAGDLDLQKVSPTNNKDVSRTMQGRIRSKVNPHLADSSNKIIRKSDSCPFRRNVGISNSGRFKEHKYRMGVFDRPDFFSDPSSNSSERQDRGSPRMGTRSPRREAKLPPAPLVTDL